MHVSLLDLHFVFKLAPCGELVFNPHPSSFSHFQVHPHILWLLKRSWVPRFEEGSTFKLLCSSFEHVTCFEEIGGGLLHDLDYRGLVNVGDGGLLLNYGETTP
jgi:hypothetical protein